MIIEQLNKFLLVSSWLAMKPAVSKMWILINNPLNWQYRKHVVRHLINIFYLKMFLPEGCI